MELAEKKDELNICKAQWENEKSAVEKLSKLREEIEQIHNDIQIAQREGNLEKAAELSYGKLPTMKKQLEIEEEKVKKEDMTLVHECVSEEEIAKIISRWTGIPVAKLTESERNKTLHLDEELHKRVIGQDLVQLFQQKDNGDGQHLVVLYQVTLDGAGEYYTMEQIFLDVDMVQISLQHNQEQ